MTWAEIVMGSRPLANLVRLYYGTWGITQLAFGIFIMAIARVSFRKGEKWAWYVSSVVTGLIVASFVQNLSVPRVVQISPLAAGIDFRIGLLMPVILGLLLPYRKFFPSK